MHSKTYLLTNIGQLYGILEADIPCLKGESMKSVDRLQNAYLLVENNIITAYGTMDQCPSLSVEITDMKGQWILPSFVDSHTHMVFAGPRQNEFVMRVQGKTYAQIAEEGGGILNSAKRLQGMSEDLLFDRAHDYLLQAIQCGTGAIEIKSGYGLETDAELKMLKVIKRLKEVSPVTVKATFLGAHAIPRQFKQDREVYIQKVMNEMLPAIADQGLADFIDVFCDEGFFTVDETSRILEAGEKYGLKAKIHGNELGLTGGVQVAVKHKALSVDHLEHVGDAEIRSLLNSNTMPVALPGSSFFLKIPYTPARTIIDAGLPIALASDFNPGSSPNLNLWFTWSLACLYNGMLPDEAFNALTINAAAALGIQKTHGSISIGKKACLQAAGPFENSSEAPYWFSKNHTKRVWTVK